MPGALADNPHHRRHRLASLLGIVGVLLVAANVGSIMMPTLVKKAPVLLLLLSSRNRHLLLTVGAGIDAVPYFVVASLRLSAAAIPFYLLGRWYGDSGLRWLERQAGGMPATISWVERGYRRFGDIVLFLMSAATSCACWPPAHDKPQRFAVVFAAGVLARLGFFWFVGKAFEDFLTKVIDWIQRYQWWLVAIFFLLTVVQSYRRSAATAEEEPPHEVDEAM
jgi:hypothetical protein